MKTIFGLKLNCEIIVNVVKIMIMHIIELVDSISRDAPDTPYIDGIHYKC